MNEIGSLVVASTAAVHGERLRSLRVVEYGGVAQQVLQDGSIGIAHAAFRRSAYLECAGQRLICIGDVSLGRGPLNARVEGFSPPRIGEAFTVISDGASLWETSPRVGRPLRAAVCALHAAAAERVPYQGLGGVIAGLSTPLIEHARPAIEALDRWLRGAALASGAETLLGLGPGLTPSGDDYVGGVLIALRAFGKASQAEALWACMAPRVPERTNRISAAHFCAAAQGQGQHALHVCLDALIEGATEGWGERIAPVVSIGHCSGWDSLAGVLAVAKGVAQ
jgi:Protein of unknown function (DUF2877)